MEFTVSVQRAKQHAAALKKTAAKMDGVSKDRAEAELRIIVEMLKGEVTQRMPTSSGSQSGGLKASLDEGTEVREAGLSLEGIVSTPLEYGPPIEFGRKPGSTPPPHKDLIPWVESHFGISGKEAKSAAIAVAKNIGKRGFKGRPEGWKMFENAWNDNAARIAGMLANIGVHISDELLRTL